MPDITLSRRCPGRASLFSFLIVIYILLVMNPNTAKAEGEFFEPRCGSEKVLRNCWTEQELQGCSKDKIIYYKKGFSSRPPKIPVPLSALCPTKPAPVNSIRRIMPDGNKKVVALTFDLCERSDEITGYDYEIVNYLRGNKIRATFFAGGKWMQTHPIKTMQLIADPLFEVGNHSWSHPNLRLMGGETLLEQIVSPQVVYRDVYMNLTSSPCAQQAGTEEIAKITPIPMCFRFPYGTCNDEALETLNNLNLPAIQWDVVTADSQKNRTAEEITKTVLGKVRPGSIIICHANGRGYHTAKALPMFVPELQKQGYSFVTVSQLLNLGPVVSTSECYTLIPGDNKNLDTRFSEGTVGRKER